MKKKQTVEQKLDRIIQLLEEIKRNGGGNVYFPYVPYNPQPTTPPGFPIPQGPWVTFTN